MSIVNAERVAEFQIPAFRSSHEAPMTSQPRLPPLSPQEEERSRFGENQQLHADQGEYHVPSVCKKCSDALLETYQHCLSKDRELPLDSARVVDEETNGKLLTEQPYFAIVKDPTKVVLADDEREKIDRDRWVLQQAKKSALRPSDSIITGGVFSGAIYKRMLDAKEREICQLQGQIYRATQLHNSDASNVQKLRKALNKSVKYYTFAEEWQQSESGRLQKDIVHLKGEIGLLMAGLIHSEEHKRMLKLQIDAQVEKVIDKDLEIKRMLDETDKVKKKLQDSFKEYLWMDQNMAVLRKEAQKGSLAAESRNLMLQSTLEKLTVDFETASNDLSLTQNRSRELDFELEMLLNQFNQLGKEKEALEDLFNQTSGKLTISDNSLLHVTAEFEQVTLAKSKLESEARISEKKNIDTSNENSIEILGLRRENASLLNRRAELESIVAANKVELNKKDSSLKDVWSQRNIMEVDMLKQAEVSKKEIGLRNVRIAELQDARSNDAKLIKKLADSKEQSMFQVTDLQNNLARETSAGQELAFELNQVRREAEEKAALVDDQIDKLNASKVNLTKDKASLTEKVKSLKTDLKQKNEDFDDTVKELSEFKRATVDARKEMNRNLGSLQSSHTILEAAHVDLNQRHQNLERTHELQTKGFGAQVLTISDLNQKISTLTEEYNSCRSLATKLDSQLQSSVDLQIATKQRLTDSQDMCAQFTTNLELTKKEALAEKILLTSSNFALNTSLYNANTDNAGLKIVIRDFRGLNANLTEILEKTQLEFSKETALRGLLEIQLHENRLSYNSERQMRVEFERLHMKLRLQDQMNQLDSKGYRYACHAKLLSATKTMGDTGRRLDDFINLLPSAEALGNMHLAIGKDFDWLFGDDSAKVSPLVLESSANRPSKKSISRGHRR